MRFLVTNNINLHDSEYINIEKINNSLFELINENEDIIVENLVIIDFLTAVFPDFNNYFINKLGGIIKNNLLINNKSIFKSESYTIQDKYLIDYIKYKYFKNDKNQLNKKEVIEIIKLLKKILSSKLSICELKVSNFEKNNYEELKRLEKKLDYHSSLYKDYKIINSINLSTNEILIYI